jgi:hypothetical protein
MRRSAGVFAIAVVLSLVWVASSLAGGDTIFETEGQAFTSRTVDFSPSCTPGSPTINWGDGTSSLGTVSGGSVSGSHTYLEEGTYSGTVHLTGPNCGVNGTNDALTADVSDATLTAGPTGSVNATATVAFNGPIATFSDADPGGASGDYAATINWGDGTSSAGSISGPSGGSFTVNGSHTYATSGSFFISITGTDQSQQGGAGGQSKSTTYLYAQATVGKAPPQFTQCPAVDANTGCQFLVVFSGGGQTVFQDVNQGPYEGAEDALIGVQNNTSKPIFALPLSAPGLFSFDSDGLCNPGSSPFAPGCRPGPHEPAGSTCGTQSGVCSFPPPPGQPPGYKEPGAIPPNTQNGYEGPTSWFSNVSTNRNSGHVNFSPPIQPGQSTYFSLEEPPTANALQVGGPTQPFLPPTVLGKLFNAFVVSGTIFVQLPPHPALDVAGDPLAITAGSTIGPGFVPLTEARQLPVGTKIDARLGKIQLVTAAAKGRGSQNGTFNGALFSVSQANRGRNKGLTTLSLLEGSFNGAPTYASCGRRASDPSTAGAYAAKLSSKVLQSLRASAHGKFKTSGRFSAATVRGTQWGQQDRCDGTFTTVQRGTVTVTDFAHHKTVIVKAGHSYLARRK